MMEETQAWFQPMGLRLRVVSDRPELIAVAEETFRGFGPPPAAADPDLTFLLEEGPGAELEVGESLVRGRFSPALWQDPAYLRLHYLEMALYLLLPGRGFLGVHGSACVRHGRAVLLRAPGGGGKTTLAYAAARGRFQALAEDVVWIAPDGNLWWGMPWRFRLRPDVVRLFPELAGRSCNGPKLEVEVANAVPSALPGPVVLLRGGPDPLGGGKGRQ